MVARVACRDIKRKARLDVWQVTSRLDCKQKPDERGRNDWRIPTKAPTHQAKRNPQMAARSIITQTGRVGLSIWDTDKVLDRWFEVGRRPVTANTTPGLRGKLEVSVADKNQAKWFEVDKIVAC